MARRAGGRALTEREVWAMGAGAFDGNFWRASWCVSGVSATAPCAELQPPRACEQWANDSARRAFFLAAARAQRGSGSYIQLLERPGSDDGGEGDCCSCCDVGCRCQALVVLRRVVWMACSILHLLCEGTARGLLFPLRLHQRSPTACYPTEETGESHDRQRLLFHIITPGRPHISITGRPDHAASPLPLPATYSETPLIHPP